MGQYRMQKLNGQLRDEISKLLLHGDIKDPRVSTFLSINRVEITTDLGYAKVFVSSFCLWILFALMPTKDTLLLLGGTYYGKKAIKQVATSEKLQKIDTIINLELDKRIKELKNAN
jgi:hypothetical protein